MSYDKPGTTQEFCFTCDQFDAATAFTGGTCQNALATFGPLIAKQAPKFTFRTTIEYAAFDYTAVSYEWYSAFWPSGIVFASVIVVVVVTIAVLYVR